ncbi:MAG TPA: tol-pal system-associated acyl-CoA thioesterase [Steroidobacteraceae bacterium]
MFSWAARVYREDTDGGGIVYYANYLRFFERARTEWLRSLGHSQKQLAQTPGNLFAVAGLSVEYRRPARLDDELTITCEPRGERATAIRFVQRIHRAPAGDLLVEADVRVVCVDAQTLRPKRLPDFLTDVLPLERS